MQSYRLIIVTNQSGIARGYLTETQLDEIHHRLLRILEDKEIYIDAIYSCPHYPHGSISSYSIECNCRKPKPGLLLEATKHFKINIDDSYMIGDKGIDIEAGKAAGTRNILISDQNNTRHQNIKPDHIVTSLLEATKRILSYDRNN